MSFAFTFYGFAKTSLKKGTNDIACSVEAYRELQWPGDHRRYDMV